MPDNFYVNENEMASLRYARQMILPEIGLAGQKRLQSAKVLCVGAGGLGSPLLLYLCAAGVGTLGMVDADVVELSNLQRQILYNTHDLHRPKSEMARTKLSALNPNTHLVAYSESLTAANASTLISQYDIIADGTDNFSTRYLINDTCFQLKKPNVYASIFQFKGQCAVFTAPKGPCFRCLYEMPPFKGTVLDCADGGVLGVLPGLLGTLQATEILKLILGIGQPLINRLLTVDALTMRFETFETSPNPHCPLCATSAAGHASPLAVAVPPCAALSHERLFEPAISVQMLQHLRQEGSDFVLLDVREPYEYAICHLNGTLIPLSSLPARASELDKNKRIIIHCRTDARSQQAVSLLKTMGFKVVHYVKGGILAWSKEIDPTLPTY